MIKVAVCDDDIATTGRIEDMLCRIAKRNYIPIETEVFWEGEHLSEAVESRNNFDVIFLDIEMGQADGITVARKIRETDKNVLIIYVTSHESYMQESFSVRPFRFSLQISCTFPLAQIPRLVLYPLLCLLYALQYYMEVMSQEIYCYA